VIAVRGQRLEQRFGSVMALGPLDLELPSGERLAVLGENGAGKTTLLRILATAARPSAGRLELFGLDATRQRDRLRARLAYVGHLPGLYPALSSLENLRFFCTLHGLPAGRAAEALELVSVPDRPAAELSRGMLQRLALARPVLHQPQLLVLDEPDAGLDEPARLLLERLFGDRTVVLATHDRSLAARLCGRLLLLRAGREEGDPLRFSVAG